MRRNALTIAVAAVVFEVALDGGTYGATSRGSLAIAVWWALALLVGLSLLPLARVPRPALYGGAALAAFALLSALSVGWADSAERAFAEFDRVALYLGVFALTVAGGKRASARRWTDGLALGLVAVGLLALAHRLLPSTFGRGDIALLDPTDPRASYPVNYWNGLAILVALAFPLLLHTATTARERVVRWAAVAPLPALAALIYLTSSRGGVATAAVGTVAFIALTNRRIPAIIAALVAAAGSAAAVGILVVRHTLVDGPVFSHAATTQGRSATALIVAVCVLTGAAYAFAVRHAPRPRSLSTWAKRVIAVAGVALLAGGIAASHPVQRFDSFKQPPAQFKGASGHLFSDDSNGRWQAWDAAVDEFRSEPLIGHGAGSYEAWWAKHASISYFTRNAHSLYLQTLGELGLAGFLLLMAALGCGAVTGARRLRAATGEDRATTAALLATFGAFAFAAGIDWMWQLTIVSVIGIVCLGLLAGPATIFAGNAQVAAQSRGPRLLRIAFAVFAALAIGGQAIPLFAQAKIGDSQSAAVRSDSDAALADARAARRVQPWAASPYLQLALVREQRGQLSDARAEIARAIDRDSTDWRLWLVAARLQNRSGLSAAAQRSLERARSLNPKSPLFARPRASRPTAHAQRSRPRPTATAPQAPAPEYVGPGSFGADVADIQQLLGANADGIFGSATAAAVAAFQRSHGLRADGVIGAQTAAALRGRQAAPGPLTAADLQDLTRK